MTLQSDALIGKQTENAIDSGNKNISVLESAMVGVGILVVQLLKAALKGSVSFAAIVAAKLIKGAGPLGTKIKIFAAEQLCGAKNRVSAFLDRKEKFARSAAEHGFAKAVLKTAGAVKDKKKLAAGIVNHVVPVACTVFLIAAVATKASAAYGVTVEYNGQQIGLVSEESVLSNAQEVIADRTAYYDIGSDMYVTATLSVIPIAEQDNVIDEQTLADALQEQMDIPLPDESEAEAAGGDILNVYGGDAQDVQAADTNENDNRERAFVVTVDGEVIGAVKDYSQIEKFLDDKMSKYAEGDVIETSFDKDIEYTYEQYVDPEDVVDQRDIIQKFDSVVSEPVYYEVQEGDNPWAIAHSNDMTTDELKDCYITYKGEQIDDITEYCPIGAMIQLSEEVPYLGVLTTKEVEYDEVIDYKIIKTEDPDMYKGDSAVDVKGVEGEKHVRARVTYKGDVPVSKEVLEETVISEPIDKQMRVGTRKTSTPVSTGTGGSGSYFWPVDGGYISAYQGDGRGHKGIDIAAPYGTPIFAAESGTVIKTGTGWNGGYGNCISIQHDDGNVTLYAHQSSLAVGYGDYVVKGQVIGYVGSTGDSSGNHLHFEVRSNGTYANPTKYVSQN